MGLKRRFHLRGPVLVPWLVVAGCSTEYADPIRSSDGTSGDDPCRVWTDVDSCRADSAHGCSFQPNRSGCVSTDPSCGPGTCQSGDPFVRRTGESLSLRGRPYTFAGAVSWALAWAEGSCIVGTVPNQEVALQRTFDDMARMRANALKVWTFQRFAGVSGRDYSSFDRVVAAARQSGVRLVFVLENHSSFCSRGPERTDAWYDRGYAAPYDGYALSYTDYVQGIVDHFRDEPTILAWELMHEARANDFGALDRFAQATSALVRATDPNHLIALGLDNGELLPGNSRFGNPSNYQRLNAHPALDLIDVHDFSGDPAPLTEDQLTIMQIARSLKKPLFAGASGVRVFDTSRASLEGRARIVDDKISGALGSGFSGFLLWDHFPDWAVPSWEFDARPEEPLAGPSGVIARRAPNP
jgi:mannan endo-1,4-beta-mannosidase